MDRVAGASVGAGSPASTRWAGTVKGSRRPLRRVRRRNPFYDWTIPKHVAGPWRPRQRAVAGGTYGSDAVFEGLSRQLHIGSHRPRQPDPSWCTAAGAPRAVTASSRLPGAVPAGPDRRRPAPDRRRRPRQPARRPPPRAGRGAGGRGEHLHGRLGQVGPARTGRPRVPALGETLLRTMMIGAGGAVDAAHRRGAVVVTPATMGVGLLEFHQIDRMVQSGREAARAMLADGFLTGRMTVEAPPPAPQPLPWPSRRPRPPTGWSARSRPGRRRSRGGCCRRSPVG